MASKIINLLKGAKNHWNTPADGNSVSNKEFVAVGLGGMGVNGIAYIGTIISFSASCFLIGPIFGLAVTDIYVVGVIGSILGLVFNPLHMMITDNLGVLAPKMQRFVNILSAVLIAIAIGIWFIPDTIVEKFLIGFPKIMSVFLISSVLAIYYRIYLLKKFSKKYGKFKPWLLFAGFPIALLLSAIAFFPYESMSYIQKLVASNFVFSMLGIFMFNYTGSLQSLSYVITPSAKERTKIISITSIFNGLLRSILGMIFPALAVITGGMLSITTYRVFIPLFCIVSLVLSYFIIVAKERVIQKEEYKPQINFKKALKEIIKNKYLWILNISGAMFTLNAVAVPVMSWMFVYTLKMEWAMGIAIGIAGLSSTPANLLTPLLVKKLGINKTFIYCRTIQVAMFGVLALGVLQANLFIYLFGAFTMTIFSTPANALAKVYVSIVWDHQQYVSGERLDGMMGIFTYLTTPIALLIGYILPYLLKINGLTSDWDILFDPSISKTIFLIHIALAAASILLSVLPFLFFDLNEKKHNEIIEELRKRAEAEELSSGAKEETVDLTIAVNEGE